MIKVTVVRSQQAKQRHHKSSVFTIFNVNLLILSCRRFLHSIKCHFYQQLLECFAVLCISQRIRVETAIICWNICLRWKQTSEQCTNYEKRYSHQESAAHKTHVTFVLFHPHWPKAVRHRPLLSLSFLL